MKKTEIRRGDIFSYDFGTRIGSIQSGVRPVLVIQADNFNANAPTVIVASITSVGSDVQAYAELIRDNIDLDILLERYPFDKELLNGMLIFLPLYSKPVDGYIYSVSLIEYVDNEIWIRMTYWGLFIALTIIGIVNILMVNFKFEKGKKVITFLSVGLSIITVLYLAIAREPYAVTVAFLLLLIKGGLLYKRAMAGR